MSCEQGCKNKHLWDEQAQSWVKCKCLLMEERDSLLKAHDIPPAYWDARLADMPAFTVDSKKTKLALMQVVDGFKKQKPPTQVFLKGRSAAVRKACLLLKKALIPYTVSQYVALDDLTTHFLSQDKKLFQQYRSANVLLLVFGDEYVSNPHKWMLKTLMELRRDPIYTTVWGCTLPSWEGVERTYDYRIEFPNGVTPVEVTDEIIQG